MASLTRWTWVWVNCGSWWWTGRPGVLWFMGSQRVGHDWATELNWTAAQSLICAWLCDPMDCSPLGSSVHRILQVRILEWISISYSRGSSWPRDQMHISWVSCSCRRILYQLHHLGSPLCANVCILSHFSGVWLFVTLWTIVSQAPLSIGFSR